MQILTIPKSESPLLVVTSKDMSKSSLISRIPRIGLASPKGHETSICPAIPNELSVDPLAFTRLTNRALSPKLFRPLKNI